MEKARRIFPMDGGEGHFVARLRKLPGSGEGFTARTDHSGRLSGYTDASQISSYATTAMQWANAEGLITGVTSTTLNPKDSATRAQVATILMRFVENIAA